MLNKHTTLEQARLHAFCTRVNKQLARLGHHGQPLVPEARLNLIAHATRPVIRTVEQVAAMYEASPGMTWSPEDLLAQEILEGSAVVLPPSSRNLGAI